LFCYFISVSMTPAQQYQRISSSNSAVIIAEIRRVLNLVCSKYSMNSSSNSGALLFSTMLIQTATQQRAFYVNVQRLAMLPISVFPLISRKI